MFNKMKEQKAVTGEVFGNWELSDEMDDADLMAVAGGNNAGGNGNGGGGNGNGGNLEVGAPLEIGLNEIIDGPDNEIYVTVRGVVPV